jgi:hypothetical protein
MTYLSSRLLTNGICQPNFNRAEAVFRDEVGKHIAQDLRRRDCLPPVRPSFSAF